MVWVCSIRCQITWPVNTMLKNYKKRFMFAEIKEPLVLIMIRVTYKNFIVIICSSPQFYSSHPLTQVTQLGFIAGQVYYFREQNYGKQHACNKNLTSSFCSNIHLISTCMLSHSAETFSFSWYHYSKQYWSMCCTTSIAFKSVLIQPSIYCTVQHWVYKTCTTDTTEFK